METINELVQRLDQLIEKSDETGASMCNDGKWSLRLAPDDAEELMDIMCLNWLHKRQMLGLIGVQIAAFGEDDTIHYWRTGPLPPKKSRTTNGIVVRYTH